MSRLSAALLLLGAILLGGSSALAQSDSDVYKSAEDFSFRLPSAVPTRR
ncbi:MULTISPECIES: hypothetical protein [Rhizobium]|nr:MULTISPECIES: hypothetical protein [Rhizobium]KAF5886612.1 hypothetical protein FY112_06390 [Rhizobium sp. PEPV16]MBY5751200.1 hypothetical protein [Rhizobium leguminosarum]MBY5777591.1 hypothetical protein [Rhizobium leguminosarum]MBY5782427.1 hypothetical protein [Rhizobium leguminosarum]MBY5791371.1 hypothetical protein [Rhizobium leguminosarum]